MSSTDLNSYELVYIIRPDVDTATIGEIQNRLTQAIADQQGEIQATEVWGKRNLAYTIQKQGTGYYVLHRFAMNPAGADEVERLLRLNENVMRYLLLRDEESE
ncbi:MAG: 30S ribosomal protein S6 [Caldilineaceae bacterium]|nr:30S ribosomal protein S6 [Caldilineaceae bacterium]